MKHTVAIPSYHRSAELRRALQALMIQERRVEEVIVIARSDDEETQAVVPTFEGKLPIVLELVNGAGVITPLNRALDVASGDILSFIDDDAAPHSDWSKRIIEVFAADPDLAGLGGRDRIFGAGGWVDGQAEIVGKVRWYGRGCGNHHIGVGPRRDVDILKGVNMSLRMSAVGKLRIDTRLRGNGAQHHWELNLCLGLRGQGKRLAYDPAIVVDHFVAPRVDGDHREVFNVLAYENEVFNLTLSLFGYLRPAPRTLLLLYALGIGIWNNYCGAAKTVLLWPRMGAKAWIKGRASARAVCAAWKASNAGSASAAASSIRNSTQIG